MGNGCTTGHIFCGVPRLNNRAIVASVAFIGSGMGMATLRSEVSFLDDGPTMDDDTYQTINLISHILWICILVLCVIFLIKDCGNNSFWERVITFCLGLIYGVGLMISGMTRISKVLGFLTLGSSWDPTLGYFFLTVILADAILFSIILGSMPRLHRQIDL